MKLEFERLGGLPHLAWQATVDTVAQTCRIRHGEWVEPLRDGFVEGAWDGEFELGAFERTANVFGSGGVARGDAMVFVSSASTTDFLYWWNDAGTGRAEISNSLPFLLAILEDSLDPACQDYHLINESIMNGIDRYRRRVPTARGEVFRLMHRNLLVRPGKVEELNKPADPPFAGFYEYIGFLDATYGRIIRNARDPKRKRPMAVLSTQSKGYDSTAMNVVARTYGVDAVFTVRQGKAKGYYGDEDRARQTDDDGTAICEALGLTCIPIDRRSIEREPADERLLYAAIHESGDFNLHAIAGHVERPSLLLTGCLGEIWYPEHYYRDRPGFINANLVRADLGNHGLGEVRLQAGYVQLAFPFLGARSREDIYRITHSREMDPWRLKVEYDRPIPRRIGESAGLPRESFGQAKMASLLEYPPPVLPVGAQLRRDYLAYLAQHGVLPALRRPLLPLVRRWNAIVNTTSPHRHRWNYYLQRVLSRLLRRPVAFQPLWSELNGRIFCYCCNLRVAEYRTALRSEPISRG